MSILRIYQYLWFHIHPHLSIHLSQAGYSLVLTFLSVALCEQRWGQVTCRYGSVTCNNSFQNLEGDQNYSKSTPEFNSGLGFGIFSWEELAGEGNGGGFGLALLITKGIQYRKENIHTARSLLPSLNLRYIYPLHFTPHLISPHLSRPPISILLPAGTLNMYTQVRHLSNVKSLWDNLLFLLSKSQLEGKAKKQIYPAQAASILAISTSRTTRTIGAYTGLDQLQNQLTLTGLYDS